MNDSHDRKKPDNELLTVTRPYLPPLEEFHPYLERIWANNWLTNNGPLHQELESALQEYLGAKHISLFANGTLALMVALRALDIRGEVITTPFSFVATSHALEWNGITPVFVDIDPETFNLDCAKVEAAINPATTAILPVHVYGTPCDVEGLDALARKHRLKLVYDAAHAFGVKLEGVPIGNFGDVSVLSFHATKVYSTVEGGAIICRDAETKKRIDLLKNFGIADETTVIGTGMNAKLNEIQAAFGLMQLPHIEANVRSRLAAAERYRAGLAGVRGITIPTPPAKATSNGGYFPILVNPDFRLTRDQLYRHLMEYNIASRRYFYPLISNLPAYAGLSSAAADKLPVANTVADSVLCLPLFTGLAETDQQRVIDVITGAARR